MSNFTSALDVGEPIYEKKADAQISADDSLNWQKRMKYHKVLLGTTYAYAKLEEVTICDVLFIYLQMSLNKATKIKD